MARIVVIDPLCDAANLVKRVLDESGHQTASFDDESEAFAWLRDKPADLVVLDVRLRNMDGMRMLRRIRRRWPRMRTLVLTTDSSNQVRQEALSAGADEYCLKPIDNEALVETVQHLLTKERGLD